MSETNESTNGPAREPVKEAWGEVAERISTLGRMMKERSQQRAAPDDPDSGAERDAHEQEAAERDAADAAALRAALDKLVAAGRELGDRVAGVARDDDVKAQAKRTSESLDGAMSATIELIEAQVRGVFGRPSSDAPPDEPFPPPASPPSASQAPPPPPG